MNILDITIYDIVRKLVYKNSIINLIETVIFYWIIFVVAAFSIIIVFGVEIANHSKNNSDEFFKNQVIWDCQHMNRCN